MKSLSRFANSLISLQKLVRALSSSSSSFRLSDRRKDAIEEARSPVYLQSMLRRPPVVRRPNLHRNSCSFIGTVIGPVKRCKSQNPRSFTFLEVKTPPSSSPSSFKILLLMRDELSEIFLKHLKPNDYIYVSGFLDSYERVDTSGKHEISYKVAVTELNYVKRNDTNKSQEPVNAAAGPTAAPLFDDDGKKIDDEEEKYRARLRLWQMFFASPHEWWDNRQGKRNLRYPDFKHRDTKECLWLSQNDPPWVRKQLQLYDSSMGATHHTHRSDAFESKITDFV